MNRRVLLKLLALPMTLSQQAIRLLAGPEKDRQYWYDWTTGETNDPTILKLPYEPQGAKLKIDQCRGPRDVLWCRTGTRGHIFYWDRSVNRLRLRYGHVELDIPPEFRTGAIDFQRGVAEDNAS